MGTTLGKIVGYVTHSGEIPLPEPTYIEPKGRVKADAKEGIHLIIIINLSR